MQNQSIKRQQFGFGFNQNQRRGYTGERGGRGQEWNAPRPHVTWGGVSTQREEESRREEPERKRRSRSRSREQTRRHSVSPSPRSRSPSRFSSSRGSNRDSQQDSWPQHRAPPRPYSDCRNSGYPRRSRSPGTTLDPYSNPASGFREGFPNPRNQSFRSRSPFPSRQNGRLGNARWEQSSRTPVAQFPPNNRSRPRSPPRRYPNAPSNQRNRFGRQEGNQSGFQANRPSGQWGNGRTDFEARTGNLEKRDFPRYERGGNGFDSVYSRTEMPSHSIDSIPHIPIGPSDNSRIDSAYPSIMKTVTTHRYPLSRELAASGSLHTTFTSSPYTKELPLKTCILKLMLDIDTFFIDNHNQIASDVPLNWQETQEPVNASDTMRIYHFVIHIDQTLVHAIDVLQYPTKECQSALRMCYLTRH